MPVITIFGGSYCNDEQAIREIGSRTGYRLITDKTIVAEASRLSNIPENRIKRVFSGKTSVFNRSTRERERSLAHLRMALATNLTEDVLIISGFAGQLIPRDIDHVLRVCLIADMTSRTAVAANEHRITQPEALKIVHSEDEKCAAWINLCHGTKEPWLASLYDIAFPIIMWPFW